MIREDKIPKHVDTNVCSEYNVVTKLIAVCTEVSAMESDGEYYREQIIQMINSTKNAGTLEYLCTFIKLFLEKWGN